MENLVKRILITGHSGFVGSWLSLLLHYKKHKIFGISLPNKKKKHIFNKCKINKLVNSSFIDIRDTILIEKKIKSIRPDLIIHLAAQPIVINSIKNPFETLETNILGTLNLLKISQKLKIKKFINFTSDKVYYNNDSNKSYKENDYLKGYDPYSLSKSCADLIGENIGNFSDLKVINLRCGNIIGGGDWSDYRIIVDYFDSLFNKKNLMIRNPESTRPWQHIFTVIHAIYSCINRTPKNYSYNISPLKNKEITVSYLIDALNNLNNRSVNVKVKPKPNIKEKKYLRINSKLFNDEIGLLDIPLSNSIKLTNNWYIASQNKKTNMYNFSINQIREYF